MPIFSWHDTLVSLIFLKRSLVFPILLFSSHSLHWSLRKAFLSLLAILWYSAFKWIYLSFSPLPLPSLLCTAIYKASSDNHFAIFHFFFLEMALITASCTMSWIYIHSSSHTLLDLRQSGWRTMDRSSWHCTGGSDQDHPQEKEMQKSKMAVWGGLTNSCE